MSPCDTITTCYNESVKQIIRFIKKTYVPMGVFSRLCSCYQCVCVKCTPSAIAAHFCRFIPVSVGTMFRRFLKCFVFINESLSLSNLCAASRSVTDRVLGRSDLSVGGWVSLGFGRLSSRGGSYPSLAGTDTLRARLRVT